MSSVRVALLIRAECQLGGRHLFNRLGGVQHRNDRWALRQLLSGEYVDTRISVCVPTSKYYKFLADYRMLEKLNG